MTRRIVSLLPAATEIVHALGLGETLVGRSHECDFPPGVEDLPPLTAPKLDPASSSEEIQASVEALIAEATAIYHVDARRLADLEPSHVLTQVHCDVCAVSLDDLEAALSHWTGTRPRLVALNPGSLDDVLFDIERVATALEVPDDGELLVARLKDRFAAVAARADRTAQRPKVACIEWLAPLMGAGNSIPELVEMAGGFNLFGEKGRHSGLLSWDDLAAADPDVVIAFPCGFSLDRVRQESKALAATGAGELRAFRQGRFYLADGNQYFNRPGPRLAESLEILAEAIHPEAFAFGHEGEGFERFAG